MKSTLVTALCIATATASQNNDVLDKWKQVECFWEPAKCGEMNTAMSVTIDKMKRKEPHALTYRFHGMSVDLFRKKEFDAWFEESMVAAPAQLHQWKDHFDNWALKRIYQKKIMLENTGSLSDFETSTFNFDDFFVDLTNDLSTIAIDAGEKVQEVVED